VRKVRVHPAHSRGHVTRPSASAAEPRSKRRRTPSGNAGARARGGAAAATRSTARTQVAANHLVLRAVLQHQPAARDRVPALRAVLQRLVETLCVPSAADTVSAALHAHLLDGRDVVGRDVPAHDDALERHVLARA
jgi:hypothetical protein